MAARTVTITHPKVKGEGQVTQESFDKVWKDKGWSLKKDDSKSKSESKSGS
jgi:hypothetical protein